MSQGRGLLIGAGGIGSQLGYFLAKTGIGLLDVTDPDVVEESNLNRQFFLPEDLGKPKGPALAKRLAAVGCLGTEIWGHPLFFSEFRSEHPTLAHDFVGCGVDNNGCRSEATRWCLDTRRPLVCVGVARDASGAYAFVQEPGQACLGCFLGSRLTDGKGSPCPGTPAVLDVLQVVCGYAAYGITSLLMDRPRSWNCVRVSMAAGTAQAARVVRRSDCPVCADVAVRNGVQEPR